MDDAATSRDSDAVFRLIYRSRNRMLTERRKAGLGEIFTVARSNNKGRQVTGALLTSGDWFAQVLEGDEETVRGLFTKIEKDGRHDRISIIETGMVDQRLFSRWAMAKVAEDGEPDIPLIAHRNGIALAASRGTTPEQEVVLDILREATRGDAHAV